MQSPLGEVTHTTRKAVLRLKGLPFSPKAEHLSCSHARVHSVLCLQPRVCAVLLFLNWCQKAGVYHLSFAGSKHAKKVKWHARADTARCSSKLTWFSVSYWTIRIQQVSRRTLLLSSKCCQGLTQHAKGHTRDSKGLQTELPSHTRWVLGGCKGSLHNVLAEGHCPITYDLEPTFSLWKELQKCERTLVHTKYLWVKYYYLYLTAVELRQTP